jgi:hypothetical protein
LRMAFLIVKTESIIPSLTGREPFTSATTYH